MTRIAAQVHVFHEQFREFMYVCKPAIVIFNFSFFISTQNSSYIYCFLLSS